MITEYNWDYRKWDNYSNDTSKQKMYEICWVNEEIYGQTMFKDIALEELKSIYEDMQIALMDGSYNELYSKGLKRK